MHFKEFIYTSKRSTNFTQVDKDNGFTPVTSKAILKLIFLEIRAI